MILVSMVGLLSCMQHAPAIEREIGSRLPGNASSAQVMACEYEVSEDQRDGELRGLVGVRLRQRSCVVGRCFDVWSVSARVRVYARVEDCEAVASEIEAEDTGSPYQWLVDETVEKLGNLAREKGEAELRRHCERL